MIYFALQERQVPSKIRHRDRLVRYSSSVDRDNFRCLYRWQNLCLDLKLLTMLEQLLEGHVQPTVFATQELQLLLILFFHELKPAQDKPTTFRFRCLLEQLNDGDQIVHLLPLQPSQSGHHVPNRQ